MCELQGGGASSTFKERVDGGTVDFMPMQIGAAIAIAEVDAELGEDNARNMKLFCHENYGIIEIAHMLGKSERSTSFLIHEGLSRLSVYYGYTKVRHTIRRQGTKVKRQAISEIRK